MSMARYALTVEDAPRNEDVQALSNGLTAHALRHTRVPGFKPIAVLMKDEHGALVGGIWGHINWNWLHVVLLWVSEEVRGSGYGCKLMEAIEQAARERGCTSAHLDTFSFQARPFYEALGYEIFCTLDDYPPGHQKFFMKKALT
jgi:GNAT superfamily N-acetyltransferase